MITEYINAALQRAKFEIIDNEKPYYGEVPELEGVWATGKTLEECRQDLAEVIDGWLVVRLRRGLPESRGWRDRREKGTQEITHTHEEVSARA